MVDAGGLANAVFDQVTHLRQRRAQPLILELDLTEGVIEGPPTDPLAAMLTLRRARLQDVLDGLRRARSDPRVGALIAKVGGRPIGFALAQEIADAVRALRQAGKLTVAFAETFGEFAPGNVPYFLACAFERIYLQPSGDVCLTGVAIEEQFLRGALDKLGVELQLGQRHEYKTAANNLREHGFTPAHRESDARIAASAAGQVISGVAAGRGLDPEQVRRLIDRGPLLGSEAVAAGLVDRLAYRDEVYAEVRARVSETTGAEPRLMYVARYNRLHALAQRLPKPREEFVALVHGIGPIRLGRTGRGPFRGATLGSDSLTAHLREAVRDPKVRAIVFRVDSPGGSYVASDAIWREVVQASRAGTPVVVSMGNVAASGGYFVAMGADAIVAQPGTLTGSIGVFGGKAVLGELFGRLGVETDAVQEGERARMFSGARGFSDTEWERVNAWLDRIYADFTAKAASGRGIDPARIDALARGRVWTGAEAHANGLVDELGGIDRAAEIARKKAGLPADAPLRAYPRMRALERLRPPESSEDRATAETAGTAWWLEAWGPLAQLAIRLGLPAGGPLLLPGAWQIR